jgi:hypothetical protein
MPINKAMELIYNIIHEQSESLTSDQLEALNLGLSALKTIEDMKLKSASLYGSNVSRETKLFLNSIYGAKNMGIKYADTDSIRCDQQNEKETKA